MTKSQGNALEIICLHFKLTTDVPPNVFNSLKNHFCPTTNNLKCFPSTHFFFSCCKQDWINSPSEILAWLTSGPLESLFWLQPHFLFLEKKIYHDEIFHWKFLIFPNCSVLCVGNIIINSLVISMYIYYILSA